MLEGKVVHAKLAQLLPFMCSIDRAISRGVLLEAFVTRQS